MTVRILFAPFFALLLTCESASAEETVVPASSPAPRSNPVTEHEIDSLRDSEPMELAGVDLATRKRVMALLDADLRKMLADQSEIDKAFASPEFFNLDSAMSAEVIDRRIELLDRRLRNFRLVMPEPALEWMLEKLRGAGISEPIVQANVASLKESTNAGLTSRAKKSGFATLEAFLEDCNQERENIETWRSRMNKRRDELAGD